MPGESNDFIESAIENGTQAATAVAKKTAITKAKELFFGDKETAAEMAAKGKGSAIVKTLYSIKDADLQLHPNDPHITKIANIYKKITERYYDTCPGLNLFYVDKEKTWVLWEKPIVRTRARPLSTFNETLHSAIDAITHDYFLRQQQKDPCLVNGEGTITDPRTLISLLLPRAVDAIERSKCENKNKLFDALSTFCSEAVPILNQKSKSEKSFFGTSEKDDYNERYTKNTHRLIKGYTKESVRRTVIPDMNVYLTTFYNQHGVLTVKLEDALRRFLPLSPYRESIETATLSIKPTIFLNQAIETDAESQIEDVVPFDLNYTRVNLVTKQFRQIYKSANDTTEIAKSFIRYFSTFTDQSNASSATDRAKCLTKHIRVIYRLVKHQSLFIKLLEKQNREFKGVKNKSNLFKLYNYSKVIELIKKTPKFKELNKKAKGTYTRQFIQKAIPAIERVIIKTFLAYHKALLADCAIKALYFFAKGSNTAASTVQVQTLITYLSSYYLKLTSVCNDLNLVVKDEFFFYANMIGLTQTISQDVTYLRIAINRAEEQRSHISDCIEPLKANGLIRTNKPKCTSQGQKLLDTALDILLDTVPFEKEFGASNLNGLLWKLAYNHAYEMKIEQGCTQHQEPTQPQFELLTDNQVTTGEMSTPLTQKPNPLVHRQRSSTRILTVVLWSNEFISNIKGRLHEAQSDYEIYSLEHRWSWSSKHSDELIEENRVKVDSISDMAQQTQDDYDNKALATIEAQEQLIIIYDSIYEIIKDKSTGEIHSIGHYLKKHFNQESSFRRYFVIKEAHTKKYKNKIPAEEPDHSCIFDNLDEYISCDESTTDNPTSTESVPTDNEASHANEEEKTEEPQPKLRRASNMKKRETKVAPKPRRMTGCCTAVKVLEPELSDLETDYTSDIDSDNEHESKTKSPAANDLTLFNDRNNRQHGLSKVQIKNKNKTKPRDKSHRRTKSAVDLTTENIKIHNGGMKRKTKSSRHITSQLTSRNMSVR